MNEGPLIPHFALLILMKLAFMGMLVAIFWDELRRYWK